ncbi:MAG: xylose isomerase, partial [Gemmatimonadaceae bacterium]
MSLSRRDLLKTAVAGATMRGALLTTIGGAAASPQQPRTFRLRYAPHFGMFRAHAGEDVVAQLEFMRAEGFTALEDNEMKARPVADQER